MTANAAALALYRRVLRVARGWAGGAAEQQQIRSEARRMLEANRSLQDAAEAVAAGHRQVDLALHYGIPFARPQHVDPGTVGGERDFYRRSSRENTKLGRMRRHVMQKQFRPPPK